MRRDAGRTRRGRRGAVAVEMAILLPFLLLAALGAADVWLLFHRASIVQECAANGAAAGAAAGATASPGARDTVIRAAVADTASPSGPGVAAVDILRPAPAAEWTPGTDGNGFTYIDVTVTYSPDGSIFAYYNTGAAPIMRTVRMMIPPAPQ